MKDQPKMTLHADGTKEWLLNNKHHRIDGPAIEWPNGDKLWLFDGRVVKWRDLFRQVNDPEIELRILIAALT